MADWSTTAFLFPGQGSQAVGMGKDIAEAYPIARETFEQADDLLGFSLSKLCFEGTGEELGDTINTQPALYVSSIAILRALQSELPEAKPAYVAGHSLGEFSAVMAAGALSFEDGLRLVRERGRLMKEAGEQNPGAMAAVLGLEADKVRNLCEQIASKTGKNLVLANDNCPGQIVISGDMEAIDQVLAVASETGARRVIKLAVSIAAHSPLMESAAAEFRKAIDNTPLKMPDIPIYANVTAKPLSTIEAIRQEMNDQLTNSVRWTESIQAVIAAGAETFVEIGSGDVLAGLMKRIDRSKTRSAINSVATLQQFLETA